LFSAALVDGFSVVEFSLSFVVVISSAMGSLLWGFSLR
jgi:hypothetical protein